MAKKLLAVLIVVALVSVVVASLVALKKDASDAGCSDKFDILMPTVLIVGLIFGASIGVYHWHSGASLTIKTLRTKQRKFPVKYVMAPVAVSLMLATVFFWLTWDCSALYSVEQLWLLLLPFISFFGYLLAAGIDYWWFRKWTKISIPGTKGVRHG